MNLTVSGFVGDLIEMYPKAFISPQKWIERYTDALNEVGTINFKKLWKIYDNEYMSTTTPPPVKWIKEAARRAKAYGNTAETYETITAVNSNGIYEFAYPSNEPMPEIEKKVENCLFWWKGTYWDCPDKYKESLEEITQILRDKVKHGKPKEQKQETQTLCDITINDIVGVDLR